MDKPEKLHNPQNSNSRRVEIIGYDSGWGCADYDCQDGPATVTADHLIHRLAAQGFSVKWRGSLGLKFLSDRKRYKTKEETLPFTLESVRRLSNYVRHAVEQHHIPVVIGGDHSSAIGTWSGTTSGLQASGELGLIWVDAHLDCHTDKTSHQGKWGGWWHGQPVAALLGHGLNIFTSIGGTKAKISPHHLSIIGPHSFEPAEMDFVTNNKIRVYFFEEVMDRGFGSVFAEALKRATDGTKGFGLTIDLDAFHPSEAPGVGAYEEKGLLAADVLPIIKSLGLHPLFKALEVAELNPARDVDGKTRKLLEKIVETIFTK